MKTFILSLRANELAKAMLVSTLLFSTLPSLAGESLTVKNQGALAAKSLPRIALLPAANQMNIAIGLRLRNLPALTNLLHELYSRTSTNFHQFLTPEQFAEQFGPSESDYQSVIQFAATNGLHVVRTFGNRAHLEVSGTVASMERAFHVTLGIYHHPTENREFYAPDVEPSVDASLPVLYIQGLDNFFIPQPTSLTEYKGGPQPNAGSGTNGLYLGSDFRHAYAPGVSLNGSGQVVGLVEFDGYTPSDITEYQNLAGVSPHVPVVPLTVDGVSNTPGSGNDEVCLDIEVAIAMAPGLYQVNVYEGAYDTSVMNEIASPTKGEPLPRQVGCSWGIGGDSAIQNALFEMALQGQSFYYACGDYGAYPTSTNPGNIVQNYMTTVGGTILSMNGNGTSWQSEVVWNDGNSTGKDITGGGILINVPIPDYQGRVNMSANGGSTQWRNIPDVAMCAQAVEIVDTQTFTNGNPNIPGHIHGVGGTSASAPLWAGFTALVNQQAVSEGEPTLGFANPAIYDISESPLYSSGLHDIVVGANTNAVSPNLYFAKPGYDLCTGWGSPTGQSLINFLTGLSGPVFVDFNYTGSTQNGNYTTPFKTLAGGVNAVGYFGTIFIKTAGSSSETMTITKPMTITAIDGAATVGQ
jgi:subtilase family serine protease